ncbi:hypothetical protein KC361_g7038 [Hortaea werneckii]|nr:hypothetical protein KC361_g7038 [Hortaea werneckii]KAI7506911.1 hypothetical protein KC347_g7262 [Hortaea werneckii]
MNRPRNRQPRSDRGGRGGGRGGGGRGRGNGPAGPPRRPKPDYDPNVPNIRQVVPGASVSIVLKADQPTGREVQGKVGELLTRGNHPRGIKVRLQDGRVGRVQRMVNADLPSTDGSAPIQVRREGPQQASSRIIKMERDVRLDEDEFPEGPPPRNLGAFFPDSPGESEDEDENAANVGTGGFATANVKCPFCDHFEGDEVAVSHHVEQHIT